MQSFRPLLWQLHGKPIYILGSIHFGPTNEFSYPEVLLTALDSTNEVFFEVQDPDAPPSTEFLKRKTGNLREEMSSGLYAELLAHANGVDFNDFKLAAVPFILGVRPYLEMGWVPQNGIDTGLCARVRKQGRPISGLETRDYQERVLMAAPPSESVVGIEFCIKTPQKLRKMVSDILHAFSTGDAWLLETIRATIPEMYPVSFDNLFPARERNWIVEIDKIVADNRSVFFVVGAMHLSEKSGLIAQLSGLGHRFDRL